MSATLSGQVAPKRAQVDGKAYSIDVFDVPNADGTIALNVNDSRTVVGYYVDSLLNYQAFERFANGVFEYPNPPQESGYSAAYGINDKGILSGVFSETSSNEAIGFIDNYGKYAALSFPAASDVMIATLNNFGELAGTFVDFANATHGFFRSRSGSYTQVDYPGSLATYVTSVNDVDTIGGFYTGSDGMPHGFTFNASAGYTAFDYPAASQTEIVGPNNYGVIVGSYVLAGASGNFIYHDNQFSDFSVPGSTAAYLTRISNNGILSGYFSDTVGEHGFIAVPHR